MVGAKQFGMTAYDALRQLPDHVVGEIIGGDLYVQPRPSLGHANVSTGLTALLYGPFRLGTGGPGGWIILDEPELHLGEPREILVPDLAGWQRARMPELPLEQGTKLAPDWVCEVLSPGTALKDRVKKLPIYAREQVGHVWLIDPAAKSLEVYRLAGSSWHLVAGYGEAERVRAEPFEAIELDLAILWAR